MALRETHWLLLWMMLGGVACLVGAALSGHTDLETACEMGRAAHLLASIVFTAVMPRIIQ